MSTLACTLHGCTVQYVQYYKNGGAGGGGGGGAHLSPDSGIGGESAVVASK